MVRSFAAAPLRSNELEIAYALIRAWHPRVTLDAWRGFAQALISGHPLAPQHGITAIRNEAGYLCGLFVYRAEADLHHGRALVVDPVAALDVIDVKSVVQAMVETAESIAHQLGCEIARFRIPAPQAWLAEQLQGTGHHVEANVLSTPVAFTMRPS